MGWIHPTSWYLYTRKESLQSINSQKGPPFRLIHIFLLSILSVMPSVWPVFGFIFSNRDLRRNLRIWWHVHTTSNDVIFTSKVPSCQVAIHWIHKIHFLCRRHTLYSAKIVDITYDDRPKLLYWTINLGGQNIVKKGRNLVKNRRK